MDKEKDFWKATKLWIKAAQANHSMRVAGKTVVMYAEWLFLLAGQISQIHQSQISVA